MIAIKGPFTYEALPPEQIEFVPLNQTKKMNGKELMEFYEVCGMDRVWTPTY